MNQDKYSEPGFARDTSRPPDYVIVVAASDWVMEHFPAAGANLRDALHAGKDRDREPEPEPEPEAEP